MSVRRASNGYVTYRVAGLNSAKQIVAYSAVFRIRWFTWQVLGLSSSRYNGNNSFTTCTRTCFSDKPFTISGRSFQHSLAENLYGGDTPDADAFRYEVNLHGLGCDTVRWTDGWSGSSVDARNRATASVILEQTQVYSGQVSVSQATSHSVRVAGHDLLSLEGNAYTYLNQDQTNTWLVFGDPAVHCSSTLP